MHVAYWSKLFVQYGFLSHQGGQRAVVYKTLAHSKWEEPSRRADRLPVPCLQGAGHCQRAEGSPLVVALVSPGSQWAAGLVAAAWSLLAITQERAVSLLKES